MYAALFSQFDREISAKVFYGYALTPAEARSFRRLLDAREAAGCQLGTFPRSDVPFDTVSGRCGHYPWMPD